jgi:hypothetical protein
MKTLIIDNMLTIGSETSAAWNQPLSEKIPSPSNQITKADMKIGHKSMYIFISATLKEGHAVA